MEGAGTINDPIECDGVNVRVKVQQVSGRVQCHYSTGFGIRKVSEGLLEKARIGIPGSAIKVFAESAIVFEVNPQPLGKTEN